MNKPLKKYIRILVGATFACALSPLAAKTLWVDDFEAGLGKWVGKSNAPAENFARLENDPVNAGHGKVVTFPTLVIEGAIYTQMMFNHAAMKKPLKLEFDYLGLPNKGGVAGNLGGYIGYARSSSPGSGPSNHRWVGGTDPNYNTYKGDSYNHIEDDGQWHHYSVDLSAAEFPDFALMLEDYLYANGVPNDAYFDNIMLADADGFDPPKPDPKPEPPKPDPKPEPPKPEPKPDPKPEPEPKPVPVPQPPKADCQCAIYTASDNSLTLPSVRLTMRNGLTGESTGEVQYFSGRMKRFELYSTMRGPMFGFNVLCDTTNPLDPGKVVPQCAATLENGTLTVPCVEIPTSGLCDDTGSSGKKCAIPERYQLTLDKMTYPKTNGNYETIESSMSFILREMKKITTTTTTITDGNVPNAISALK